MKGVPGALPVVLAGFLALSAGAVESAAPTNLPPLEIVFGRPEKVTAGGYGRVRPLGDGRFALVYACGRTLWFRTSADRCRTWGEPVRVATAFEANGVEVFPANAEILRLKSGRLVYPFNWRPKDSRATDHPYAIALATSDDGGKAWSAPRTLYRATNVVDGVCRGCYEPFAEERDGCVRIYFADESPYVEGRRKFQNISCMESCDGGETWGEAHVYCYKPQARDGMPVALRMGGYTYVAIETNGGRTKLHPEIVRDDGVRMQPFLRPDDWTRTYAGAPYLAATENFVLLSCQTSAGSREPSDRFVACEVRAMAKDEMRGGLMQAFRAAARPLAVDQTKEASLWNALCPLGGDDFLVVSQYHNAIYLTRGRVRTKEKPRADRRQAPGAKERLDAGDGRVDDERKQ